MRFARKNAIKTPDIPEDTRPLGSVNWADPSRSAMSSRINTFNPEKYFSPNAHGEQTGIRSGPGINSAAASTYWEHEQFRAMERRNGFRDEDDDG